MVPAATLGGVALALVFALGDARVFTGSSVHPAGVGHHPAGHPGRLLPTSPSVSVHSWRLLAGNSSSSNDTCSPCYCCQQEPDSRSPCAQTCLQLLSNATLCSQCRTASLVPLPRDSKGRIVYCKPNSDGVSPCAGLPGQPNVTYAVNQLSSTPGVGKAEATSSGPNPVCPTSDCCCGRASQTCKDTVCTTVTCPSYDVNVISAYCLIPNDGTKAYNMFSHSRAGADCCCLTTRPQRASDGTLCSSVQCPYKLTKQIYCTKVQ